MNPDSSAAAVFCGNFIRTSGAKPLGAKEWNTVCAQLEKDGIQPFSLLDFSKSDFDKFAPEELKSRLVSLLESKTRYFQKLPFTGIKVFRLLRYTTAVIQKSF